MDGWLDRQTDRTNECNRLSAGLRTRLKIALSSGSKMLISSVYIAANCVRNMNTSS